MRDEHFEIFIEKFGEATTHVSIPIADLENCRSTLPPALLEYWAAEGWSGYGKGIFWLVNPDDYDDVLAEWIVGTPLERLDHFHVIARTAFGNLYLWGEKTGQSARIVPWDHAIYSLEKNLKRTLKDPDLSLRAVFSSKSPKDVDISDEHGKSLFEQALTTLGPLQPDEMYGFEPAILLGGRFTIDHLRIVKIREHLSLLRQLAGPRFPMGNLKIDKLL